MRSFQIAFAGNPDHRIKIKIGYALWPLIRSDQWFLPRFRLQVTNLGAEIPSGTISIGIAKEDDLPRLSEITTFAGPFQDVYSRNISSFLPRKTESFVFKIQSKFIKPDHYFLRIRFIKWIPLESPIRELQRALAGMNPDDAVRAHIEALNMESWERMGVNPKVKVENAFRGEQLFDYRSNEIIKVHSLGSTVQILSLFIGSVIAGLGILYTITKLIVNNWAQISCWFSGVLNL